MPPEAENIKSAAAGVTVKLDLLNKDLFIFINLMTGYVVSVPPPECWIMVYRHCRQLPIWPESSNGPTKDRRIIGYF